MFTPRGAPQSKTALICNRSLMEKTASKAKGKDHVLYLIQVVPLLACFPLIPVSTRFIKRPIFWPKVFFFN